MDLVQRLKIVEGSENREARNSHGHLKSKTYSKEGQNYDSQDQRSDKSPNKDKKTSKNDLIQEINEKLDSEGDAKIYSKTASNFMPANVTKLHTAGVSGHRRRESVPGEQSNLGSIEDGILAISNNVNDQDDQSAMSGLTGPPNPILQNFAKSDAMSTNSQATGLDQQKSQKLNANNLSTASGQLHTKSLSTANQHNSNFFSNMQVTSQTSNNAVAVEHQKQYLNTPMSFGQYQNDQISSFNQFQHHAITGAPSSAVSQIKENASTLSGVGAVRANTRPSKLSVNRKGAGNAVIPVQADPNTRKGTAGSSTTKTSTKHGNETHQGIKRVPSKGKISDQNGNRKMTGGFQKNMNNITDPSNEYEGQVSRKQSKSQGKSRFDSVKTTDVPLSAELPPNHQSMIGQKPPFQVVSMPQMVSGGDPFQAFNFIAPTLPSGQPFQFTSQGIMAPHQMIQQQQQQLFATSGAIQGYPVQAQPTIHFVAKQQKFYGISPERAPQLFNNNNNYQSNSDEKRPNTSSYFMPGTHNKKNNENKKMSKQSQAIAALYLGNKSTMQTSTTAQGQQRNLSQPKHQNISNLQQHASVTNSAGVITGKGNHNGKSRVGAKTSASANLTRKQAMLTNSIIPGHQGSNAVVINHITGPLSSNLSKKEQEVLYEEVIQTKQLNNKYIDENVKLKTKLKFLENEVSRKEKVLEDMLQNNQFIQNSAKQMGFNGGLAPIVQTAQKYQQETFLVLSLKKQVKEMKSEIIKKDEEIKQQKKSMKLTRVNELENEVRIYRDELIRMRCLCEEYMRGEKSGKGLSGHAKLNNLSCQNLTQSQNPGSSLSQNHLKIQNNSQPTINDGGDSQNHPHSTQNSKLTASQKNFFSDNHNVQSMLNNSWMASNFNPNLQQQLPVYNMNHTQNFFFGQTLSNEESSSTNEQSPRLKAESQLPPLEKSKHQMGIVQNHLGQRINDPEFTQLSSTPLIPSRLADETPCTMSNMGVSQLGFNSISNQIEEGYINLLKSQLQERENMILTLRQQIEQLQSKQSTQDLGQTPDQPNPSKGEKVDKSKGELSRLRKQLTLKDKELVKLRSDAQTAQAEVSQLKAAVEEKQTKMKSLQTQHAQQSKKLADVKAEIQKKDQVIDKLLKETTTKEKDVSRKEKVEKTDAATNTDLEKKHDDIGNKKEERDTVEQSSSKAEEVLAQASHLTKELTQTKLESKTKMKAQIPDKFENKATDQLIFVPSTIEEDKSQSQEQKVDQNKEVVANQEHDEDWLNLLSESEEGELCLLATVVGCRESKDRIEFAIYLKKLVSQEKDQKKSESQEKETPYKIIMSDNLMEVLKKLSVDKIALLMPKYDLITPSLACILMKEVRNMLSHKDMLEILEEKKEETKLPFDALRDLCMRFNTPLSDEHCAFLTASYIQEFNKGAIYIDFKEFLAELKDGPIGKMENLELMRSKGLSLTESLCSEDSGDVSNSQNRIKSEERPGKHGSRLSRGSRKSMDEEYMLDVAESIFIRLAKKMVEGGRTIRGVFTKFSTPEMLPDRSVLELLSPIGLMQGFKEAGLKDLSELEIQSVMKILLKPELDNSIILNEFILIMENFGVQDQVEEEVLDDYIPDTETEIDKQSQIGEKKIDEENKKESEETKEKDNKVEERRDSKKKRVHNLQNIDEKGIKILRKLARFLLINFLHPREFFGKYIAKDKIKTKKREFILDVMKFKDFYLKIKIANIRKKLTENESLNKEICLDSKRHPNLINVRIMVKALEEIAEEEQVKLIKEEEEEAMKAREEKNKKILTENIDSSPRDGKDIKDGKGIDSKEKKTGDIAVKKGEKGKNGKGINPVAGELGKFGNTKVDPYGSSSRSPLLGTAGFIHLNTIEEERFETYTSNYMESASDRDSKVMVSQHLKQSHAGKDYDNESERDPLKMSPDFLDKSLGNESGRDYLPDQQKLGERNSAIRTQKISKSHVGSSFENLRELQQDKISISFRNKQRHSATEVMTDKAGKLAESDGDEEEDDYESDQQELVDDVKVEIPCSHGADKEQKLKSDSQIQSKADMVGNKANDKKGENESEDDDYSEDDQ